MDRTSQNAVFVCALLLFVLFVYTTPPPPKPKPVVAATVPTSAPAPEGDKSSSPGTLSSSTPPPVTEQLSTLENAAIKVTLTSRGATIKTIELKEHRSDKTGNIVLNEQSHSNVLELRGWPGADVLGFQVAQSTPDQITYTSQLSGVKWERSYSFVAKKDTDVGMSGYLRELFHHVALKLGQKDTAPLIYNLDVRDSLTNTGTADVNLPSFALGLGRAEPLRVRGHYQAISNQYLGSGWFTQKFFLTTISDFDPSTFLWLFKRRDARDFFYSTNQDPAPLRWIGVENQFYTVLLTPTADHPIDKGEFECFNPRNPDGYITPQYDKYGYIVPGSEPDIEAAAHFPEVKIAAGQTVSFDYGLYAGPKEFNRLDALGDDQGELMNYGMFSILIVPMLTILHFWDLIFRNYGVAIILLTLMIKGITWPLQSVANRSGKRMQALAPKLKELQAKYKDQPEKLQTETFAMYKDYGVNPFGGCLPALVQMPVFFSLYFMLQNAVELRGQSFLWVHDLTQPDTVATISLPFVLPILNINILSLNPLPIIVTGLTMVMMRMTPQIGDPQQAKIAQWMPLVFLFIFYNFAAALSLYYVINNCVSIIQIYRNLKKPMPELVRRPRK